jgi:hypothetical protein
METRFIPGLSAWLGGLALGVATGVALSSPATVSDAKRNPNVVVLRAEKTVTIEEEHATLVDLAHRIAKQTGFAVTLDPQYQKSPKRYGVLLRSVPYSRVLTVMGYYTGGKWVRSGHRLHLRARTPEEASMDAESAEALVKELRDYLGGIDWQDRSLPESVGSALASFQNGPNNLLDEFPLFAGEEMDRWSIRKSGRGLSITYQAREEGDSSLQVQVKTRFWTLPNDGNELHPVTGGTTNG